MVDFETRMVEAHDSFKETSLRYALLFKTAKDRKAFTEARVGRIKRMWINQPSSLQPLHELHGRNVLTIDEETVYFTCGEVVSMMVPQNTLSEGWK